ncbi:DUF1648 domain-containing protein [Kitasatospora sp. NPDC004240]
MTWAVGVTVILAALPWSVGDRLPNPLATHWRGDTPDGSMPLWAACLGPATVWAVLALGVAAALRWGGSAARPWAVPTLVPAGTLLTGAQISVVRANLDRPTWQDARPVGLDVVLVLAAAAGAALLALTLARRATATATAAPAAPAGEAAARGPVLDVPEGEHLVWLSRTTNPWLALMAAIGGLLTLAAVLAAVGGLFADAPEAAWAIAAPAAITSLAALVCSSVQARVTAEGLAVALGPLGWPVRRWPPEDVEAARAEPRTAAESGGWGYRLTGRGTTVMLRSGECLVVRNRCGAEFAVSVDDAGRGAALLNALASVRTGETGDHRQ